MKIKIVTTLIILLILSGCTSNLNVDSHNKEISNNTVTENQIDNEKKPKDLNNLFAYYDQEETSILKNQFEVLDADEKTVFDLNQTLIIANKKTKIVYILIYYQSKYNNGVAFSVLYDETGKPMTKEKYIELYKN